jgi:hypothetical protein
LGEGVVAVGVMGLQLAVLCCAVVQVGRGSHFFLGSFLSSPSLAFSVVVRISLRAADPVQFDSACSSSRSRSRSASSVSVSMSMSGVWRLSASASASVTVSLYHHAHPLF